MANMFQGIGALLNGAMGEAKNIRDEREKKAQDDMHLEMGILSNIIENPQITNPQLKQEALDASRNLVFSHLFPDQFKDKPGKLHKLVKEFVGQNAQGGNALALPSLNGEGTGRGNAKSSVGGIAPPVPQSGTMPPQMSALRAEPVRANIDTPLGGGSRVQVDLTSQNGAVNAPIQTNIPGMMPPPIATPPEMQEPQRTAAGFVDPIEMSKWQASLAQKADRAKMDYEAKLRKEGEIVKMPFDMGPAKAGQEIDARILPSIVAGLNAAKPDIITHARTTVDGHEVLTLIDKNTLKKVGEVDTGMVSAGVKSQFNLWYDGVTRETGKAPSVEQQEAKQKELAQDGSDMILSRGLALINAREGASADLADKRTARAEVAKAFEPLREGISRFNTMTKVANDLAAGKSKNPGSDDMVLLSNHIAMTFGDVKGARTGRDLIEAHLKARSLPAELEVAARRVLNGDQLTTAQRAQFVNLAKDKLEEMKASFERTKLLWQYEPPGNDAFFKMEGAAYNAPDKGGSNLSLDDFNKWKADQGIK